MNTFKNRFIDALLTYHCPHSFDSISCNTDMKYTVYKLKDIAKDLFIPKGKDLIVRWNLSNSLFKNHSLLNILEERHSTFYTMNTYLIQFISMFDKVATYLNSRDKAKGYRSPEKVSILEYLSKAWLSKVLHYKKEKQNSN